VKLAAPLALILRHLIDDHGLSSVANAFGLTSESIAAVQSGAAQLDDHKAVVAGISGLVLRVGPTFVRFP